jgi:hypothetical protein
MLYIKIVEVFAVPGPPIIRVEVIPFSFLASERFSGRLAIFLRIYSPLVESIVGMSSWEKLSFLG